MTLYLWNIGDVANPTVLTDWWTGSDHSANPAGFPTAADDIIIESNAMSESYDLVQFGTYATVTLQSGKMLMALSVTATTITIDGGMAYGVLNGHVICTNGGYAQSATVNGNLDITNSTSAVMNLIVNGNVTVDTNSSSDGWQSVDIYGNLTINGATIGGSSMTVTGALDASNGYIEASNWLLSATSSLRLPGSSTWLYGANSPAVAPAASVLFGTSNLGTPGQLRLPTSAPQIRLGRRRR